MAVIRRISILAALVALTIALTGCTREITRVEVVQSPESCFSCHGDANTDLVDAEQQWNNSRHASGSTLNENDSSCKDCHTSEGFIARATGVPAPGTIENPTAIHCFTCHAPHTSGDFRLRWNAVATLMDGTSFDLSSGNICVACHQARRDVNTYVAGRPNLTNRWGPHHSPQGDMLIGSNGYEYAGYVYGSTNHRGAAGDGCLDCHFNATSQYVVGGHSFNMRGDVHGEEVLNVGACVTCHGDADDFNEAGNYAVQDSIEVLLTDLRARLVAAGLVNASTGLPLSTSTSADSAGAVWNYLIVEEDRSHGVHNPQYAIDLLRSAIQYISGPAPYAVHVNTRRD